MKKYFLMVASLVALAACEQEEKTTASGFKYETLGEETKVEADSGNFFIMNLKLSADDSVIYSSQERGMPADYPVMPTLKEREKGTIVEVFQLLANNDSIYAEIPAPDFYKGGPGLPPSIDSTTIMKVELGLIDILSAEDRMTYMTEANQKLQEKQKKEDLAKIEEYIAENNLENVESTESGLHYIVTEEGEGESPEATDVVEVHYTGFLLDGTKFESSKDNGEPVTFPLNRVIPGWTEGVQLMKEGAEYKFIIPSSMAYGPRGSRAIPPNSVLIFDVELLDINPENEEQ
ncbi:FKBP-type peptidyl-prolyl cis-trans isomerase [Mangrovivirga sp. M17]|uniref:Peptidyl-prolyl cis-trans isomerase n=1 Tax=Mangrovivirga halotolerans TaxID=2993936 RepID=A0ABT3RMW5_9BACT|nr:FKBP-type peptidyl-prolyl cis-trans isomerase [Mangrovivirga halotolerans]MCX2743156.1 FKBP-type peptidyl-prolyl cis-trans isomerase [Mangrovivirga halotolerans]